MLSTIGSKLHWEYIHVCSFIHLQFHLHLWSITSSMYWYTPSCLLPPSPGLCPASLMYQLLSANCLLLTNPCLGLYGGNGPAYNRTPPRYIQHNHIIIHLYTVMQSIFYTTCTVQAICQWYISSHAVNIRIGQSICTCAWCDSSTEDVLHIHHDSLVHCVSDGTCRHVWNGRTFQPKSMHLPIADWPATPRNHHSYNIHVC